MQNRHMARLGILVLIIGMAAGPTPGQVGTSFPVSPQAKKVESVPAISPQQRAEVAKSLGKLPLAFEVNEGQTDSTVKFLSRQGNSTLFLTNHEAVLDVVNRQGEPVRLPTLPSRDQLKTNPSKVSRSTLRLRLDGANEHAEVVGEEELPGKTNYFKGNDPKQWHSNVANYQKVRYHNVYPGVDVVYYGNEDSRLEHDFIVSPGVDPRVIVLDAAAGLARHPSTENGGVKPHLRITANGDLIVTAGAEEFRLLKPVLYQPAINDAPRTSDLGLRTPVEGNYTLDAQNRVGFHVGAYDRTKPLIIDPVLVWGTYASPYIVTYPTPIGIALDTLGNIYVAAETQDLTFQGTAGSFDPTYSAGANLMTVVMKINPSATAVIYSTLLGGNQAPAGQSTVSTFANSLAVDSNGDAIVGGDTYAANFPTTQSGWRTTSGTDGQGQADGSNGYVTVLSPDGSSLIYSTYVGGTSEASGQSPINDVFGVAVDTAGKVYATGQTTASNWGYLGGFEPQCPQLGTANGSGYCQLGGYVAKFDPTLSGEASLVYFSYLGGGEGLASLPDYDVSVAAGYAIAVDANGDAFVTGYAGTSDFPVTPGAFQTTFGDAATCPANAIPTGNCADAFLAEVNPTGSALLYSTYLGGAGVDFGYAVTVDASGNAYVTGNTSAANLPITPNAFQTNNQQPGTGSCCWQLGTKELYALSGNAFVTELNPSGSSEVYSTYFGGMAGTGIAVDSSGDIFVSTLNFSETAPLLDSFWDAIYSPSAGIVAEFLPSGSLAFSTILPGPNGAYPQFNALALDGFGNVYVAGSGVFPTTPGVISNTYAGYGGGLAKLATVNAASAVVTPVSLTFASQSVGTSSQQSTQIYSFGSVPLNITNITASGDFSADPSCVATQTFDSPCAINVTFAPTSTGPLTGTLTITDNASGSPQSFNLTGTGTAPLADVSTPSLAFGNQSVGTTSTSQPVTLSNPGTAALTLAGIGTSANFGENNNCGTSLTVGGSCTINVTFTPTASGLLTGALTITDNSTGVAGSMQTVSLTGTGISGSASLSATTEAFGNWVTNTTSTARTVTLTNTGTVSLNVWGPTIGGANASDFRVTSSTPARLAPAAKFTISLTYTPTTLGAETATLNVADSASNTPQTATLTGTGIQPASLSATGLGFGNVGENSPTAVKNITLTNNQTVALSLSGITITGANSGDFSQTNPCNGSVAAKGTCIIGLTYTPSVLGGETATLNVADSASNTPQTATLTGTGIQPATLSATGLGFGNVGENSPSAVKTLTLTNNMTVALALSSVTFTGTNSADFGETNPCGGSVAAKSTCVIRLTYTPSVLGAETATLNVSDNASNSPQTTTLTGSGILPATLSPTGLGFGNVGENSPSAVKNITLTNNQTVALSLSGITITGANSSDFSQTNPCNGSVAAKGTCIIGLTFTPSTLLAETATVNVNDSASNTPLTATLTGMGIAPATLSATGLGFGNVSQSTASNAKTLTLTNNMTVALALSSVTFTGTNSADFGETNPCGGSVAAKGTCVISLTYTPSVLGAETATLNVSDNASNSPQTTTLTGSGILPATLSPTGLGFGNVPQSTASNAKTLTLTNNQTVALTLTGITTTGANSTDFRETNTCGGSVVAKGTCTITVTFTPSIIGAETGILTVADTASNTPQATTLTGTGIVQAKVAPVSLALAAEDVGITSPGKSVTLTNNLSAALPVSITFAGADPGDFGETDTCSGSVGAASACTITVTFTPVAVGARTAILNVSDSANNTPQTVALAGTGK